MISLLNSLKNNYQRCFNSSLVIVTLLCPTFVQSDEIKYVVVWSSNSPHGPIAGIARNFDQITFNNLEDCQDQIAKELFGDESYGDWAMMKSYYGDTNRIGARLKEDSDNYNARTLYICDTLEPYPD